jgi:hypothetical protein
MRNILCDRCRVIIREGDKFELMVRNHLSSFNQISCSQMAQSLCEGCSVELEKFLAATTPCNNMVPLGATSICSTCGEPILYHGENWQHTTLQPQHSATPQRPRPGSGN